MLILIPVIIYYASPKRKSNNKNTTHNTVADLDVFPFFRQNVLLSVFTSVVVKIIYFFLFHFLVSHISQIYYLRYCELQDFFFFDTICLICNIVNIFSYAVHRCAPYNLFSLHTKQKNKQKKTQFSVQLLFYKYRTDFFMSSSLHHTILQSIFL